MLVGNLTAPLDRPSRERRVAASGRRERSRAQRVRPEEDRAGSARTAERGDPDVELAVAQSVDAVLRAEGTPMSDHRASSAYRTAMLGTSLERFFVETQESQEAVR